MQFSTSLAALTPLSLSFLSHAGVFETNTGIPIVVVVTKADLIDSKAAENPLRRVSEDKLDAVQVRVLFSFNHITEYFTNLMLLLNDYSSALLAAVVPQARRRARLHLCRPRHELRCPSPLHHVALPAQQQRQWPDRRR
jgi:hypothetical protein